MKVLEELWFGNIKPNENRLQPDSEQCELVKLIVRHEEALQSMLSEQMTETYEKLRVCQSELSSRAECEAFVSGFRLGAKIMLEVMEASDNE